VATSAGRRADPYAGRVDGLPVVTERLIVRRFDGADVAAFAAYRSDPGVARYQSWEAPVPVSDAKRLVAEFAAAEDEIRAHASLIVHCRCFTALTTSAQVTGDPSKWSLAPMRTECNAVGPQPTAEPHRPAGGLVRTKEAELECPASREWHLERLSDC